jgi:tubulin-specific chaperone C
LSCSSRPIIENSSEIGFVEYPALIADHVGLGKMKKEDWMVNELVEDFNWLRREHSPNWRILEDKIGDDTWSKVLELLKTDVLSVDTVLELVMKR